jgi:hypothetical protein
VAEVALGFLRDIFGRLEETHSPTLPFADSKKVSCVTFYCKLKYALYVMSRKTLFSPSASNR